MCNYSTACGSNNSAPAPLGMEEGSIEDIQITASSQLSQEWMPRYARLNNQRAWASYFAQPKK